MMKKSFLKLSVVWALAIFLLVACGDDNSNNPDDKTDMLTIGLLVPTSGSGKYFGNGCKVAAEEAMRDYQAYLKAEYPDKLVKIITYNTNTDPATALSGLKALHAEGVRFVVGPASSAATEVCLEYANANNMYLFSVSTVGNSLAKKDNLYRFVPKMQSQDKAIIKAISLGNLAIAGEISQTATIYRNDAWGKQLSDTINEFIGGSGGLFLANEPIIGYAPASYNVKDIIKNVNDEMVAVRDNESKSASAFGIMLFSFAEGTEFLAEAAKYEWLTKLMWYGGSAYPQEPSLLENPVAAEFAYKTRFSCPIFALNYDYKTKWEPIRNEIENATGKPSNSYAILGYDATMLAFLCETAIMKDATLANDVDALIRTTLAGYKCTTGEFELDANGDRPEENYNFWSIRKDAITKEYKWVVTGTYYPKTDKLSFSKEYYD